MITLIGLGAGDADTLSRGAERALKQGSALHCEGKGVLLLRTARHTVVETLRVEGFHFESLDSLYEQQPSFEQVYASIVERVMTEARRGTPVYYAVPGHPLVGESASEQILREAEAEGIGVEIVASSSFIEATMTAGRRGLGEGIDIRDALTLRDFDAVARDGMPLSGGINVANGLLLLQLYDTASASHAKLCLMRHYPDDWQVLVIARAGVVGQERVQYVPLHRLDREPMDHLTSLYVPPLPPDLRRPDFGTLVGIMARLRAPDGCPWDREQSHATLRKYFIEETYEVIEAIDADDPDLLCEELGDALLQVVFHAQLAREEGIFDMDDVIGQICQKLVRRHPHVFGAIDVADSDEVLRNWEQIKRAEKAGSERNRRDSLLDGIPKGLPALMYAMEMSKRVVKVGFEWKQFSDVWDKFQEESRELRAELDRAEPNKEAILSELGDLLFTIVQIARWQKVDPEEALRQMLTRFSNRFRHIERRSKELSRVLTEMGLEEMDALWDEAKRLGM